MIEKSHITNENDATIVNPVDSNSGESTINPNMPAASSQMRPIYEETTHVSSSNTDMGSLVDIELAIGSVIKDTFELVAILGEGGMGTVYKALNKVWAEVEARDPYVAIKVLKPELSANKKLVRSLYSDFDRTKMLANCPNIIKVHGFDRDGPLVYMTMEYLTGQTLGKYLNHEPMNLAEAWFIIEGIGNALAYAHENNIVHRDIKPGNIIITNDAIVKVLDFGIASKINEHEGDETKFGGHELGALTVAYASPEMQRDYPPDARDDIYAFACVIYEVLTGKQFYKQKTHKAAHIKGLNSRQMDALNKALAFERDQRTASVHELLEKLRPVKTPWVKYGTISGSVVVLIIMALWGIQKYVANVPTELISHEDTAKIAAELKAKEDAAKISTESKAKEDAAKIATESKAKEDAAEISTESKAKEQNNHISTSSDGIVQLQTSKPDFKNGESFQLSFRLTQPMYVRIIDRDAKGVITMLRPNPRQPDKLLPANKEHLFPPKGFNVPVKGPSGNCIVTIVASAQPFSKATKLLNDDGSVSQQVQNDSYSWTQIRYTLHQ